MLYIVQIVLYLSIFNKHSAFTSSVPRDYGEIKLFDTPVTYDLDTAVTLADEKQEIGYNMTAVLTVEAAGSDGDTDFLLKFHLKPPQLRLRGRPERSSWEAHGDSEFFALWSRGRVRSAYLDPGDSLDILNYKIALISLFQFQVIDGEDVETDISGTCDVSYETVSMTDIRKIKTRCRDGAEGAVELQYSLEPSLRALAAVRLRETLQLGPALAARVTGELRARGQGPGPGSARRGLQEALGALPAALAARPLEPADDDVTEESLEAALATHGAALAAAEEEAGGGGRLAAARAALQLLPALQAASAPALLAALRAPGAASLPALCRLLGLAGTEAAHRAAASFLALAAAEPSAELAAEYLAGAALAVRPQPAAVRALLRLAGDARHAPVATRALLAAAAAAPRAPDASLVPAVRDAALRALARCKEDECRAGRLLALGNLRDSASADVLTEHAERGGPGAALAALLALHALPAAAVRARAARLEAVALGPGRPLEVRAAALDLVLGRAGPGRLPRLAAGLSAAPQELRRLLWQRAEQLAAEHGAWRAALRALPAAHRSLWARGPAGSSSVLARRPGWATGAGQARLEAVLLAARGLLRRATVALHVPAAEDTGLELEVSVWTRGLEALAGGEGPDDLDEGPSALGGAEVSGGLALAVGGVRQPAATLFTGQAELLSHVWAGTGSSPTPVLRALRVLRARGGRRRLATGAALAWRAGAAAALALDAQAQVSLWSRAAKLALRLRAALHEATSARLQPPCAPHAQLSARWERGAEPRLRIAADLDFYDGVALCARVHVDDHSVETDSSLGARRVHAVQPAAGRTLALGRPNDLTCRELAPAHDEL